MSICNDIPIASSVAGYLSDSLKTSSVHKVVHVFEDVGFKVVIGCCHHGSGDSIEVGLAVISSRERRVVDCPGEEETHFDEKMSLVLAHTTMEMTGVMFICGCDELDHRIPGYVSKA